MTNPELNDKSTSRRSFLQAGTLASAAAVAGLRHPHVAHAAETSADGNREIRLGIVGCGGRGTGALNDSLSINENVKVVAAADLWVDRCERVRENLSRRYADKIDLKDNKMYAGLDAYQEILDDPDVDVVLFTTSPGFRPRHIAEAVQAGKHVFAEKPTCVDPAGYRICLAAHEEAKQKGTAIVTGTQYRRQSNYIGAVEQIRNGLIGDVVSAVTRYCSNGIWFKNREEGMSDTEYQLYNWMHFIWLSGDQITEQAVHNIDAMNWVMDGPPESVYGSGGRFTRPEGSEMWDSMSLDYRYPGNRIVSFKCRQIPSTKSDNGSTIYGTEGFMHIGFGSNGSYATDRDGKEIWSMKGSIADAYKQEHKDLVDSVRAGKPIVELKETAMSSLTAAMGRMAAYSGDEVTWDFVTEKSELDLFPKELSMEGSRPESSYAIPGQYKLV